MLITHVQQESHLWSQGKFGDKTIVASKLFPFDSLLQVRKWVGIHIHTCIYMHAYIHPSIHPSIHPTGLFFRVPTLRRPGAKHPRAVSQATTPWRSTSPPRPKSSPRAAAPSGHGWLCWSNAWENGWWRCRKDWRWSRAWDDTFLASPGGMNGSDMYTYVYIYVSIYVCMYV